MSAPVDRHTLGVVVEALATALTYEWRDPPSAALARDVRVARQVAHTVLAWGRELCLAAGCANCGSTRLVVCPDCDWPLGAPRPDADFCSICRRRHGTEVTHAGE